MVTHFRDWRHPISISRICVKFLFTFSFLKSYNKTMPNSGMAVSEILITLQNTSHRLSFPTVTFSCTKYYFPFDLNVKQYLIQHHYHCHLNASHYNWFMYSFFILGKFLKHDFYTFIKFWKVWLLNISYSRLYCFIIVSTEW